MGNNGEVIRHDKKCYGATRYVNLYGPEGVGGVFGNRHELYDFVSIDVYIRARYAWGPILGSTFCS